jgi:hypothetical protein
MKISKLANLGILYNFSDENARERAGLKPPAQFMEAILTGSIHRHRADGQARLSGVPRTEAGIYMYPILWDVPPNHDCGESAWVWQRKVLSRRLSVVGVFIFSIYQLSFLQESEH